MDRTPHKDLTSQWSTMKETVFSLKMASSGSNIQLKDYFSRISFNKYFALFGVFLFSIFNLFMNLLNAWPYI